MHSHTVYIGSHIHTIFGTTSNSENGEIINIMNSFLKLM
ncbi:conserved hypothetical protein [Xenorhabdus bovienii str. oregonense]|uniref:Uncharacterized protein n=1 Tax=Xenorhabdus bovienii str. oregonense TaxID=1398202 RepID=A0A077P031_XENBV|nr:conserved hypothetical protein [Xenorhabdus bovienii str. oregonense]